MRRCARLALAREKTSLVILSATRNTTNLLEQSRFGQVRLQHNTLLEELGLSPDLVAPLYREMERLKPEDWAGRCALGERLSSQIFAAHLASISERPVSLLDARDIIVTDKNIKRGVPQIEKIATKCQRELVPLLKKGNMVITQGFIGSTAEGETTLLGREGSDYSATLLAEAIGADRVDIWSDVPGIFSADPNIVPAARAIHRLSFPAAGALAQCGAKILFPDTLRPAERRGIPVFIRSSLEPHLAGTRIAPDIACPPGPLALVLSRHRLSLIGKQPDEIPIKLPELNRGEYHRTYQICGNSSVRQEMLRQWHRHFFANHYRLNV